MAIKGSLKEASLPDVLQLLSMGKKSGCLGTLVPRQLRLDLLRQRPHLSRRDRKPPARYRERRLYAFHVDERHVQLRARRRAGGRRRARFRRPTVVAARRRATGRRVVAHREENSELRCRLQHRSPAPHQEQGRSLSGAGSAASAPRRTSRHQRPDPRFRPRRVRRGEGALRTAQRIVSAARLAARERRRRFPATRARSSGASLPVPCTERECTTKRSASSGAWSRKRPTRSRLFILD